MGKNLTGINQKLNVFRFMDFVEKTELRKEYSDILENKIPLVERDLSKAMIAFEELKDKLKDAKEFYNATLNESKSIATEVKRGVKEINLDDQFTWRVAFDNRYFFFTYIDKQIKLCKVQEIPEHEKMDLFNAMHRNDVFFNEELGVEDLEEKKVV